MPAMFVLMSYPLTMTSQLKELYRYIRQLLSIQYIQYLLPLGPSLCILG